MDKLRQAGGQLVFEECERICVCVCVLVLCLCCWLCAGLRVSLDVGNLQDRKQQLQCVLDVVDAVGTLRTVNIVIKTI